MQGKDCNERPVHHFGNHVETGEGGLKRGSEKNKSEEDTAGKQTTLGMHTVRYLMANPAKSSKS